MNNISNIPEPVWAVVFGLAQNALRCRAFHVQLQEFLTGLSTILVFLIGKIPDKLLPPENQCN